MTLSKLIKGHISATNDIYRIFEFFFDNLASYKLPIVSFHLEIRVGKKFRNFQKQGGIENLER